MKAAGNRRTSFLLGSLFLIFSGLSSGCHRYESQNIPSAMQEIFGREENEKRFPVYRMRVPETWIRRDALQEESLLDTTKAICEFIIVDGAEQIRIAIHNFPASSLEQRIPPHAQVARWEKQFASLDPSESSMTPVAFSGYKGLFFSGRGVMQDNPTTVLAWALQLPLEHFQNLSAPSNEEEQKLHRQMRADVTIKAIGPSHLIQKYRYAIMTFSQTFELIKEIPTNS